MAIRHLDPRERLGIEHHRFVDDLGFRQDVGRDRVYFIGSERTGRGKWHLLLSALYALATERLDQRALRPGLAAAGALFATGAVAALALALTMALEKGWLTVVLALMVPGIAWVSDKRPLPALM